MAPALLPYGLSVSMWFCPVRTEDFDKANTLFEATYHHPIQTGHVDTHSLPNIQWQMTGNSGAQSWFY
ncbi:MAG: hypothetical protein ABSG78_09875 [Verrucomicrobiota bacterium]|jgi:hypothetical protein